MTKKVFSETIAYYTYEEAFQQVQIKVERHLERAPIIVRKYIRHLAMAQGKFLRTRALLISSLNNENKIHENAVTVSAAMELLHLATLVHDDVIDDAKTRRGIDTLQEKFGKKTAVICGDYLLSLSLKTFMELTEKDKYREVFLPDYVSRVCFGELLQHENNGNAALSIHKYLRIVRGKTAALFEGAFRAGAIFADDERVSKYEKLGRYIGMIFQLTDDCIDYEATEGQAKKTVQSDYEQGVITLPLIYAISNAPEAKTDIANGKMESFEVKKLVEKTGGVRFTKLFSKRYYIKAARIIEELNIGEEKKSGLTAILEKAYNGVI